MLVFPLLLLSSSVLLPPPAESLALRCPKLLLYLESGGGLGEVDADGKNGASCRAGDSRDEGCLRTPNASRFLASARALSAEAWPSDPRGDDVSSCSAGAGEADNEGALNGTKDTDGRLPTLGTPSFDLRDDLDPWADR